MALLGSLSPDIRLAFEEYTQNPWCWNSGTVGMLGGWCLLYGDKNVLRAMHEAALSSIPGPRLLRYMEKVLANQASLGFTWEDRSARGGLVEIANPLGE